MTRRFLIAAFAVASASPLLCQPVSAGPGNTRRLDFLAGYLGLSDSQKAQAKTIFDAADQSAQTLFGQLTSARDALRDAVKSSKPDAELDRLGAAAGAVEGQLAAVHAKASVKFYALLTPEQKTKYDQMGERSPGGGRGPGPGRGGFGGR